MAARVRIPLGVHSFPQVKLHFAASNCELCSTVQASVKTSDDLGTVRDVIRRRASGASRPASRRSSDSWTSPAELPT